MKQKIHQVTDNIHGTIFLSALESELISTPYFYRLHDIYQCSTVYMAYPTNRTKRYEHSLGTMELASTMLFSAISNAEKDVKDLFFSQLNRIYEKIYERAIVRTIDQNARYFTEIRKPLDVFLERLSKHESGDGNTKIKEKIKEKIELAEIDGIFSDSALDRYHYHHTKKAIRESAKKMSASKKQARLKRRILWVHSYIDVFFRL